MDNYNQERSNSVVFLRGGVVIDRALARLNDSDFRDFIIDNKFNVNLQPQADRAFRKMRIIDRLGSYLVACNQYKDSNQNLTELKLPESKRREMVATILESVLVRNLYNNPVQNSTELYLREFFSMIDGLKDYELLYIFSSPNRRYDIAVLDVTSVDFNNTLCPEDDFSVRRDYDASNFPRP